MAGKLENKVAWVSGANKGIGEGIARLYAGKKSRLSGKTASWILTLTCSLVKEVPGRFQMES